jgi:hypothetical protein
MGSKLWKVNINFYLGLKYNEHKSNQKPKEFQNTQIDHDKDMFSSKFKHGTRKSLTKTKICNNVSSKKNLL